NERFRFPRVGRLARFVFVAAKHGKAAGVHMPTLRYANFYSTKYAVDFENRFRLHVGIPKVQFDAPKNGGGSASLEIRGGHTPFTTPEHGYSIQHSGGNARTGHFLPEIIKGFCFGAKEATRFKGSPHQEQSKRDKPNGPQVREPQVRNSKYIELQKSTGQD